MDGLPIGDYALLSDCHSAALVSRAGSVDWLCFPRFDAPAVFARILDTGGGYFAIRPAGDFQASRAYVDQTMALETTFRTATGTAVLTDAMGGNVGHIAANDRRGGDTPVVFPHVGEGCEPVAVADRIQPSPRDACRPQLPVHRHRAPGLEPRMLQAEAAGSRPAAHGNQDLVAGKLTPVRQRRHDRAAAAQAAGRGHAGPGHHGDAQLGQGGDSPPPPPHAGR